MSVDTNTEVQITLSTSAIEAHKEALALIQKATVWAQCADLSYDEMMADDGKAGERIYEERQKKLVEMERSYYSNFAHMITMSQGWDGPLNVWRDTEACMYWRHEKGYEGGLIFHRDLSLSKPGEPLTIGTWSIHT